MQITFLGKLKVLPEQMKLATGKIACCHTESLSMRTTASLSCLEAHLCSGGCVEEAAPTVGAHSQHQAPVARERHGLCPRVPLHAEAVHPLEGAHVPQ